MIRTYLAAAAALLLAACGQSTAPATEEAPAPQGLFEQVEAMSPETQPVFAYQQLTAYQQAHPEVTPPCTSVRSTERVAVPGNVDPASIYAAHTTDAVFAVQCASSHRQRTVHAIGAAVGADDIAVRARRRRANDGAALLCRGGVPVNQSRAEASCVGSQADVRGRAQCV